MNFKIIFFFPKPSFQVKFHVELDKNVVALVEAGMWEAFTPNYWLLQNCSEALLLTLGFPGTQIANHCFRMIAAISRTKEEKVSFDRIS